MILNYSSTMVTLKIFPRPTIITSITNQKKATPKPPFLTLAAASYSTTNKISSSSSSSNSSISNQQRPVDTEKLRTQLDQLYAEAETTRSKANNARLRLLRLSEAAESLQKRAASSVLVGKETEARELLIQKKKLMQALEKSKNRIDVLDKFAVKINELVSHLSSHGYFPGVLYDIILMAISLKEAQLIGNVARYPEFTQKESDHQIRFVNPKVENYEDSNKTNGLDIDYVKTDRDDDERETDNGEENLLVGYEEQSIKESSSIVTSNHESLARNLSEMSSYEEFLQYLDGQLQNVESELVTVLKLTTLILESEERKGSAKVKQTSEILKDVRSIRERIASIIKAQIDEKAS